MGGKRTKALQLEEGENLESSHFRLSKDDQLRFLLGSSLHPSKVDIYCNYPAKDKQYDRDAFHKLEWCYPFKSNADNGDRYTILDIHRSGNFKFYAEKDGKAVCQGYFIVEPILETGSGTLSLDTIVMQTYLTKSLGNFKDWESRLMVAKESGYNMIHFTPIQELGESQSSYSIQSQLDLNAQLKNVTFDDVHSLVKKMQTEWDVLSLVDVVWNHTANTTSWLSDHPEAAYNLENSPHLRPAFLLDRALWHLNREIEAGKWEHIGLPSTIDDPYHLDRIAHIYWNSIVPALKLQEFFMVDVDQIIVDFKDVLSAKKANKSLAAEFCDIKIIQDPLYRRNRSTIDLKKAVDLYFATQDHEADVDCFLKKLEDHLKKLNEEKEQLMLAHHEAIIYNIVGDIKYHFLADHGPKHGKVTTKTPIMTRYFVCPKLDSNLEEEEALMNSSMNKFIFAHQGWVMNGDALKDFAAPDSDVYLRRELIAWGDSVKLRYGNKKEDCPFLWDHMKKYTEQMARIFHGVRIDNCHSTPIPVAEYLLDAGRQINPNLYVVAELFTNSEVVDNVFINKLGINSLIRERMSAGDARDLGRLVHRYGGQPVGSFLQSSSTPLSSSMAHALFMDLTHDNRSPMEVRSVYDFLPSAALVAASSCAIGSNRGYDEIVPHHISVVKETRLYKSWGEKDGKEINAVSFGNGILCAKRALNDFHKNLSRQGYNQVYVDQVNSDVVSVTRHCPESHESMIIVAHTAFHEPAKHHLPTVQDSHKYSADVPPMIIPGTLVEIAFEALMLEDLDAPEYEKDPFFINGVDRFKFKIKEHISVNNSSICGIVDSEESDSVEVVFDNFPPGSVVIFKVSLLAKAKSAVQQLRCALNMFPEQGFQFDINADPGIRPFDPIMKELSLTGLNRILYRCHAEEVDDGHGGGVYDIPNFGALTYCGLQDLSVFGWFQHDNKETDGTNLTLRFVARVEKPIQGFLSVLSVVRSANDLGHPICENLRSGDWMPEYIANRLKHNHLTRKFGLWMESVLSYLRDLPRFLIPSYFDAVITSVYTRLIEFACSEMSSFVQRGSTMIKYLALGSVQFCGLTNSAPLPRLPHSMHNMREALTMAAGLPHFSRDMWRCWGRDTFISLRGMLLVTGRFQVAKALILAFGGCVRHGLIANLLNKGFHARFNCRDAVWWWLQMIKDYCLMAPDGYAILSEKVPRMYPEDDSMALTTAATEQPLHDIMQEILQKHVDGISFRERDAGPSLDSNMTDEGFNVTAKIDEITGFPVGGNSWNCGTWMDKVGGSHMSGNWGHPATPRDGSAVEIVGLCKSIVTWLSKCYEEKNFPYEGVLFKGSTMSFADWANKIQASFERSFWIGLEASEDNELVDSKLVHRRGIYKDCFGASHAFTDYQLRPNFPIAMAVAPELFNPKNALHALKMVEDVLTGPLGLATLDPRDWAYDGYYENDLDSTVFNKALGFNYHQGPEWVWVYGPFLRAKLFFAKELCSKADFEESVKYVRSVLARHKEEILTSPWRGLPEITNKDGAFCEHGCPTQAWSMACILEVLYDLERMVSE